MRTPLILGALLSAVLLNACSPSSSTAPAASTVSGHVTGASAPGASSNAAPTVEKQLGAAGVAPDMIQALTSDQYDAVVKQSHGFQVGQSMARDTGFVFFDPQCPHCGNLWAQIEPLRNSTNVRWIPVAFLNARSLPQGVALITAADSTALMISHEQSLANNQGGLPVTGTPDKQVADEVTANFRLLQSLGASAVPFLVHKSADGQARALRGELTTEQLRLFLNS